VIICAPQRAKSGHDTRPDSPDLTRITAIFFALTTSLISSTLKQTNIHNDRRFLQTDSEENPEVRTCTKDCSPHLPVLLCFHGVRVRSDGRHARSLVNEPCRRRRHQSSPAAVPDPVTRNECSGYRFLGFFFGCPGRYDLTRLFSYTSSMTAGLAG